MTDGVSIVSSTQGATSAVSTVQSASRAAPVSAPASISTVTTDYGFTPRVVNDPQAGIITQYLSANGAQVVSQVPSAVTVAYLRIGLTADGTPKHAANAVTA